MAKRRRPPKRATPHPEDTLAGHERELVKRDSTLPRIKVKPRGRAVDALRALDECLEDLYRPERAIEQFYRPSADYAYLNYAVVRTREGWLDPIGHHRIQIPYQEYDVKARRWNLRHKQMIVRSGKELHELSQTEEWRRARFAEATGDWLRVVPREDYRRLIEAGARDSFEQAIQAQSRDLREARRAEVERRMQLREAAGLAREAAVDTFGTDMSALVPDPMRAVDSDYYVPIAGGQMQRQLYLYAHWEQTAKAFEMKNHSELAKAAINIKSDFTLGRGMAWKLENPRVAEVWQEFWDRNKMETRIRQISDDLTWQGELLIRKYEQPRGFLCVRSMDPGAFQEIVTDPQDIETVFFYAQSSPTPYQMVSWDLRGEKLHIPSQRYVIQQYPPSEMIHLKSNVSSGEKWGRSDFYTAFTTLKRHRDWTNAATLKDMLAANLVWKIKVTGDQGDVDAFVSDSLNATLPPMGGTWVENEAITLEPMHAEFGGSGRMGQGSVGNFLVALFANSQNMPVSYFNISPGGTARATALTQGEPFIKAIATRQQTMRQLLDELFEEVMERAVRAGRLAADALRGEKADPEWIFPSPFEEDRGAKFRDLRAAREAAVISHETMAVQMAQELGQDEYSYAEEMDRIVKERTSPVLMLWPEKTEQEALLNPSAIGMEGGGGMPGMGGPPGGGGPPPPNPFGSDKDAGAPPVDGGSGEEPAGRGESLKGADERADFRRQWAGRASGGNSPPVQREADRAIAGRDQRFLQAALPGLKPGDTIRLPSGRIARVGGSLVEATAESKAEAGRKVAREKMPELGKCSKCGAPAEDRHHKDGDTHNNAEKNVQPLCRSCHMKQDDRVANLHEADESYFATCERDEGGRCVAQGEPGHQHDDEPVTVERGRETPEDRAAGNTPKGYAKRTPGGFDIPPPPADLDPNDPWKGAAPEGKAYMRQSHADLAQQATREERRQVDLVRFREMKARWADLNNKLLDEDDNPTGPQAQRLTKEMKTLVKEMYRLDVDPGGWEGVGLPGGTRDIVVIGAGPGGIASAVMGGADGLDTLLIDAADRPGGQAKYSSRIENYPGLEIGRSGQRLTRDMFSQAERLGAETKLGVGVTGLRHDPETGLKTLTLSNGETVTARAVVIAGGLQFIRSEQLFTGATSERVVYGDAASLERQAQGKPAVVLGGGNSAGQAALSTARSASQVYVIARRPLVDTMSEYLVNELRHHPKIQVIEGEQVRAFNQDKGHLLTDKRTLPTSAVGVFFGANPITDWLPSEVTLRDGKIETDRDYQTGVPGVFAVGDIRHGAIGRIGAAVGDGQFAVYHAFQYFEREKAKAAEKAKSKATST